MTTRTDAHAPVNLVTEDYEYVFAADTNGPWALHLDRDFLLELNGNPDPSDPHPATNQCSHCGQYLRYVAWLRHLPTGYVITVGETCLDNRFSQATDAFQALRKGAALDRKAQRIVKLRNEFVAANPDLAFLNDKDHEHTNSFVADVARKLRRYGELSERQVDAVRRSIVRDAEFAAKRAEQQAADAETNWIPVPSGRIVVEGVVLSAKWKDSDFGSNLKLLIQVDTAAGSFKVYGNAPISLLGRNEWDDEGQISVPAVGRGDKVRFTATVERAPWSDDEFFGTFKRPAKAEIVERAPEPAVA